MARGNVRKRHPKRKSASKRRSSALSTHAFILYLASALVLRGTQWVSKENQVTLTRAIQAAYAVVAEMAGDSALRFIIIPHRVHGTSADVDDMIAYLLTHWARKDRNRHIIHLDTLPTDIAGKYLSDPQAKSEAMWLIAADAFLEVMKEANAVGSRIVALR
ncbi:hypothetical protein KI440_02840 [Candidatus Saccharibacteria bacterium TM7i]|nr:hypothetical protein KI440_02840 [Candidatus Saccharibacteria bacterium TM7i]